VVEVREHRRARLPQLPRANTTLAGEGCKRSGDRRICRAAGSFARELERRCPRVDAIEEGHDAL